MYYIYVIYIYHSEGGTERDEAGRRERVEILEQPKLIYDEKNQKSVCLEYKKLGRDIKGLFRVMVLS